MSLAFFPMVQGVAVTLVHFLWQGALLGLLAWAALRLMRGDAFRRYVTGVVMMAAMLAAPIATFLYVRPHAEAAGLASAAALEGVATTVTSTPRSGPPARPAESGSAAVIVVFWLAGVAVLSVRLAGGWMVAWRCARRAIRPVPPPVHALVRRIAGRLALDRVVRVFESAAVDVPMMIGWIAPVVLLPTAALSGLAPAQLEALVAH